MVDEKNRNYSIDLLKAVATYLVCYSHFNNFGMVDVTYYFTLPGMVGYGMLTIAAYAVPIFLLINGYLTIHREYPMKVYIKKTVRIILITFTWGMLYNLIFAVAFNEKKNLIDVVRNIYWGVYQGEYISIRNWFFWTLAIIYLFLPFLHIIFKEGNQQIVRYLFGLIFIFTIGNDAVTRIFCIISLHSGVNLMEFSNVFPRVNVFSSWDSFALTYFIAGGMIYRHGKKIFGKLNKVKMFFCLIGCSFTLILYGLWYMEKTGEYYNIVWNSYPCITLFIGAVLLVNELMNKKLELPKKWQGLVTRISKNSMGIYFVHLLIGTLLKPLYYSLYGNEKLLMGIAFSVIVFWGSFAICELIRRIPILKYMVNF